MINFTSRAARNMRHRLWLLFAILVISFTSSVQAQVSGSALHDGRSGHEGPSTSSAEDDCPPTSREHVRPARFIAL